MLLNSLITRAQLRELKNNPAAANLVSLFLQTTYGLFIRCPTQETRNDASGSDKSLSILDSSWVESDFVCKANAKAMMQEVAGETFVSQIKITCQNKVVVDDDSINLASSIIGFNIRTEKPIKSLLSHKTVFYIDINYEHFNSAKVLGFKHSDLTKNFTADVRMVFYVAIINSILLKAIDVIDDVQKEGVKDIALSFSIVTTGLFSDHGIGIEREVNEILTHCKDQAGYSDLTFVEVTNLKNFKYDIGYSPIVYQGDSYVKSHQISKRSFYLYITPMSANKTIWLEQYRRATLAPASITSSKI